MEEDCKIFVGGVSWVTTEEVLKQHFGNYGTVARAVIARDRKTGCPRGFAFVSFTQQSAVTNVLQVQTHHILGTTVDVKKAIPRGEQCQSQPQHIRNNGRTNSKNNEHFNTKKIFVGGLSANLTKDEFRNYFEQFGKIRDAVVMHDNITQRSRGFGFITFDSEDAVEEVMMTSFHELAGKQAEVKRAVPKQGNNTGHNVRVGGGRGSNFNNYQNESPRYGTEGYSGVGGYPYRPGVFGVGFPVGGYSGIGYGLAPFVLKSSWNGPVMFGFTGNPFPANFYSAYVNGVGIMGANGYNRVTGIPANGNSNRLGGGDVRVGVVDKKFPNMDSENFDNDSLASCGSSAATSDLSLLANNRRLVASDSS